MTQESTKSEINPIDILNLIETNQFNDWYLSNLDPTNIPKANEYSKQVFAVLDILIKNDNIYPYEIMNHMGYTIITPNSIKLR